MIAKLTSLLELKKELQKNFAELKIDLFPSERRPEWINIFSPWDLISGALNFYDLPGKPNPVTNLEDHDASVLLGAHTQYWSNELLFDQLHQALL